VLNDTTRFDATGYLTLLMRVQQMAARQPELGLQDYLRGQEAEDERA